MPASFGTCRAREAAGAKFASDAGACSESVSSCCSSLLLLRPVAPPVSRSFFSSFFSSSLFLFVSSLFFSMFCNLFRCHAPSRRSLGFGPCSPNLLVNHPTVSCAYLGDRQQQLATIALFKKAQGGRCSDGVESAGVKTRPKGELAAGRNRKYLGRPGTESIEQRGHAGFAR